MPGLTNRLLARVVDAAAITYEESARFFGSKAFVSGNPVRPEFFQDEGAYGHQGDDLSRGRDGDPAVSPPRTARVLVFGGSQGAHAINMAMVEAAPRLAAEPRVAITHQTGERDLEMVRDSYRRAGLQARVEPFLFAMDREMKAADLVVCRAGATTLAELTAAGRAADPGTAADRDRRSPAQERACAGQAGRRAHAGSARALGRPAGGGDRRVCSRTPSSGGRLAQRRAGWHGPTRQESIVDRVLALAGRAT